MLIDSPLRIPQKEIVSRSDRVKALDMHAEEPWVIVALYKGTIDLWNFNTKVKWKLISICFCDPGSGGVEVI